jgi:hypothetical protein
VVNETRLLTRGGGRGSTATAGIDWSGDWMKWCRRRAACIPDAARALRTTFAFYGLGETVGEACDAATALREEYVAGCDVVRMRSTEVLVAELWSRWIAPIFG